MVMGRSMLRTMLVLEVGLWIGRAIFSRCMRHLRMRGTMRLRVCLESLERTSLREKPRAIDLCKISFLSRFAHIIPCSIRHDGPSILFSLFLSFSFFGCSLFI